MSHIVEEEKSQKVDGTLSFGRGFPPPTDGPGGQSAFTRVPQPPTTRADASTPGDGSTGVGLLSLCSQKQQAAMLRDLLQPDGPGATSDVPLR